MYNSLHGWYVTHCMVDIAVLSETLEATHESLIPLEEDENEEEARKGIGQWKRRYKMPSTSHESWAGRMPL